MAFTDVIARLAVSLNLDTAAFQTGSRRAQREASGLQGHMSKVAKAVGGALAGMVTFEAIQQFRNITKAAIDAAGGLGETAAQIGVTTKSLQEYRFAATQVGLSTQDMEGALGQLTRRLGDAALGVKEPADALERLGIKLDDIKGKETGDVIPLIAAGIAKIADPAERASIAVDLFGRSGQKLLPLFEGGAQGVEAFRVEAERLGLVLSEGEIAKADETADKLAALNYQIEAQSNKKLLENADAVIAYEQAVGNFKLALITAVGDLEAGNQRYNAWALEFNANLRSAINGVVAFAVSLPAKLREAASNGISAAATIGANIVQGIARGIRQAPEAVWNALKSVISSGITNAKDLLGIRSPSRVFMEIGAFIGDGLAIGIERGQGRVAAATKLLTEAARRQAEETRSLFARLFPEIERAANYQADLKRIAGSGRSDDAQSEARRRLGLEFSGTGGEIDVFTAQGPLNVTKGLDDVLSALDVFKRRTGSTTVTVAKSFKDMADATVQSLSNLANSIRGGGFLGILESVIGLGLQLGSIGAFGSKIASRINAPKVPGYANGTNYHPGGLAVVGERRAELVELPRGSRVHPSLDGIGGGRLQVEVIANNNGFGAIVRNHAGQVVAEAAPALMDGGAQVAQSRMSYRSTRRVG